MKFVSLFAGIGGIDLGLERAGHQCIGQVEIDEYATRVLERHWPDTPRIRDVRDFHGHEFGQFDMLVGGYPCQPFSIAGSRQGDRDERHLWPEVLRILRNVRPKYLFVENVTGHLSLGFGRVLGDLAESGYDAEWDCIPAAAVGANHRRDRVFIIGRRQDVADTDKQRPDIRETHGNSQSIRDQFGHSEESKRGWYQQQLRITGSSQNVANAKRSRSQGQRPLRDTSSAAQGGQGQTTQPVNVGKQSVWAIEPDVGRVADGIPARVDRLRALGNAVVPQVAEWIGWRLPL